MILTKATRQISFIVLLWIGSFLSVFANNTGGVVSDSLSETSDGESQDTSIILGEEPILHIFDSSIEDMFFLWQNRMMQTSDCNEKDVNPTKIDKEVYIDRLSKLPNVMEMVYNETVRSYIEMYSKRRKQISYMLGLSQYYFPLFEEALEAQNLPLELKYLPIIESALNPRACSPSGAAGLWQFMPGTGKVYGLENNSLIDERRDPLKATYAATKYLKDLYAIYQDWTLVIAAYNCGPGTINKAIRRANGKHDYWQIYNYLPPQTRGYVPAFIATNYIMNYASEHNICPAETVIRPYNDTIVVNDRLSLQQVAEKIDIPIEELRLLNPQYKRDIIPGNIKPYALRLPNNYAYIFIQNQDSIFTYRNELVEQRLEVTPNKSGTYSKSGSNIHMVKRGESLSSIAKKYNISVKNLRAWNSLHGNALQVGKKLKVGYARGFTYTVQKGDTLWLISQKTGVPPEKIKLANSPKSMDLLYPVPTIKIPKK